MIYHIDEEADQQEPIPLMSMSIQEEQQAQESYLIWNTQSYLLWYNHHRLHHRQQLQLHHQPHRHQLHHHRLQHLQ